MDFTEKTVDKLKSEQYWNELKKVVTSCIDSLQKFTFELDKTSFVLPEYTVWRNMLLKCVVMCNISTLFSFCENVSGAFSIIFDSTKDYNKDDKQFD